MYKLEINFYIVLKLLVKLYKYVYLRQYEAVYKDGTCTDNNLFTTMRSHTIKYINHMYRIFNRHLLF